MLRIWGRLNSVNVEKVVWCASELGLAFERIEAGGAFGMVDTPQFRALNPNGRVPVIEDEGFVLWESNAIVRYLAARYGTGTLMPTDVRQRADIDRWMDFQLGTVAPLMSVVFRGLVRTAPEARDTTAIARAFSEAGAALGVVNAALAERAFLAGDAFSAADIPLGSVTHRWLNLPLDGSGLERPSLRHLEDWYGRLLQRPAAARLLVTPLS